MKIFFDTEFTGLHKNTTLISIGLIDENGRTFYAEFNDYDKSQCDDWIKENVIKHLKFKEYSAYLPGLDFNYKSNVEVKSNKLTIQTYLEQWLIPYDEVELVSDVCHYDMVLFIDIWGGAFDIPRCINPACHDINQDIARYYEISETEAFDLSREGIIESYNENIKEHWPNKIIKIEGNKHNSLCDALAIKEIYNIITNYIIIIE